MLHSNTKRGQVNTALVDAAGINPRLLKKKERCSSMQAVNWKQVRENKNLSSFLEEESEEKSKEE